MSCHYSFGGQKRKRWLTFKSSPSAPQTSSAVLPSCPADTTHGRCACFRRRFVKFWGADHSALGVSALARLHGLISDRDRQTVFRPQRGEEMRARGGRRRRSDAAVTWLLCPTARGGSGDFVLPRLHPISTPPQKKLHPRFPHLGPFLVPPSLEESTGGEKRRRKHVWRDMGRWSLSTLKTLDYVTFKHGCVAAHTQVSTFRCIYGLGGTQAICCMCV